MDPTIPPDTEPDTGPGNVFDTPKGGLYGGAFDPSALDPNVRAVLMGYRWTTAFEGQVPATTLTYFFPTSTNDYLSAPGGYPDDGDLATFQPLTAAQRTAALTAFGLVSSYTGLTFVEAATGSGADATFRFARFDDGEGGSYSNFPPNSGPYSPSDSRAGGDTFLGDNGNTPTNFFGTDEFNTVIHELGHAFGLKHGHDASYNGALAPEVNDNEFSVMTYASYLGSPAGRVTVAINGSSPQSYMMYDIAALQALYGANFSKVGTQAVYQWDASTGQEYINGEAAPFTGVSVTQKIFSTVWTQGATTTYDLSNFNEDQVDDLRPGHWLTFSRAQIADLNWQAAPGTPQYQAQGNIYNALLYNGDTRSLISNLITGNGNDIVTGNDADNTITTNGGTDTISVGSGNNIVSAGAGADLIHFGSGQDMLHDLLADLNGDLVTGFTRSSMVEIEGALVDRGALHVTMGTGVATLGAGGFSFQLQGDFTGGDFMASARGVGSAAHTSLSFVNLLPSLAEGVSVAPAEVNGIANAPFLTGDGATSFSVEIKSAVSSYSNMLGYYKVQVNGTISDVHLLAEDTLAPSLTGHTIALDTPGDGEHLGFFLVQNGFSLYGDLPDDLSFLTSDTHSVGSLDAGGSLLLYSASRGSLSAAQVFHSFANLNPDHATQVLSGTGLGGGELQIGFEDLTGPGSDNDFQDVIIGVLTSSHDFLLA
ncbi:DUF4114 domain-containing protein [Roseixanthobacter pseudopolyaromaticivorans]|uniref:DUF4114 domain-containing protein n=1 Tax=Xanthobacteraceae TaxID=335928 RepID=UPI00372B434C